MKTFKQLDEANAVSGGKVHKFITGKNLTHEGKKYSNLHFEVLRIDNNSKLVTLKILSPKPLFGKEINVPFRTIRRGPFLKTDTSGLDEWNREKNNMKTFKQFIEEAVTLEQFNSTWKKRPVYGIGEWRIGMGSDEQQRRFNTALMQFYIKHFGGEKVWTKTFQKRYLGAMWQGKSITYKKKRYPFSNGMDEKDFVFDFLVEQGILKK